MGGPRNYHAKWSQSDKETISAGEGVEKKEPYYSEIIMLNEVSQTKRHQHQMLSLTYGI